MKTYNLLISNDLRKSFYKNEDTIVIEEKFSFMAFFFQVFWLLYNKIWKPAIIVLLINVLLLIALQTKMINDQFFHSLQFVVSITIGLFANSWYIENLKRKQYPQTIIVAKNIDEAKLRFYQLLNQEEVDDIR